MNALQQNNNGGSQSYLLNDYPALNEIAIKYSGIGRTTGLLARDIFNFKLEQPGRNLNFCHVANDFAK